MRKSISVAFFSTVSTLMVLGIVLMGGSEWLLFSNFCQGPLRHAG